MNRPLFTTALLLATACSSEQPPDVGWARVFPYVAFEDIVERPDGGLIAVGLSTSDERAQGAPFGQYTNRPIALWISAEGDIEWEAERFVGKYDLAAADPSGRVFVAGFFGDGIEDRATRLVALDDRGRVEWQFEWEEMGSPQYLEADGRGGAFVFDSQQQLWAIDENGQPRWVHEFGDDGEFLDVGVEPDGSAVLLSSRGDYERGRLIERRYVSPAGDVRVEETRYPGPDSDYVTFGRLGRSRFLVVSDFPFSNLGEAEDIAMYVFDDDGLAWDGLFPRRDKMIVDRSGVAMMDDGGVVFAGSIPPDDPEHSEAPWQARLRRHASDGALHYSHRFRFGDDLTADASCPFSDAATADIHGTFANHVVPSAQPGRLILAGFQACRHSWLTVMEEP